MKLKKVIEVLTKADLMDKEVEFNTIDRQSLTLLSMHYDKESRIVNIEIGEKYAD